MAQESATQVTADHTRGDDHANKNRLGPILCWAVVFADIGTSVYYTPGILYLTVGSLAGFFVFLTMTVFVLLTLKYAEVTHRFPQGGGVVTVAAQAMNHWVGALGGMFILVDYFLTASISCLSGMIYVAVVVPSIGPYVLWITVGVLVLLGTLNWIGISESAKVSLCVAIVAFLSDAAILVTVFTHVSLAEFGHIFQLMFVGRSLGPKELLVGFAGSFLAFSGLESISQLSPVMRTPRKKVAAIALFIVVITVGLTSPLLTMFSTILLPKEAQDPVLQNQLISLLGGHWGGPVLQTEIAISAGALLVFASNTAIIGAYHVFIALARLEFFPTFILKRNKLRDTPHISIILATGIPILILVAVGGRIDLLGDMYAFGLLGAFSLTCLGLDIVRYRERRAVHLMEKRGLAVNGTGKDLNAAVLEEAKEISQELLHRHGNSTGGLELDQIAKMAEPVHTWRQEVRHLWRGLDFWLGVLTTVLVVLAWSTNLVAKPLATLFGGSFTLIGMGVALLNYRLTRKQGRVAVVVSTSVGRLPGSVLAILTDENGRNDAIIRTAIHIADDNPVVFLYLGKPGPERTPSMFEVVDPYLEDAKAKEYFSKAEGLAQKAKIQRRFLYRKKGPETISLAWHAIHPRDIVMAVDPDTKIADVNPDRVRYEITSHGKVAHLLKTW